MNLLRTPLLPLVLNGLLLFSAPLAAQNEIDDASNVVASYPVRSGALLGSPTADDLAIWAAVAAAVPSPLLGLVDTLELFQVPPNLQDEEIGTDAYASLNDNGTTFTLGLNLDSALSAFVDHDPDTLASFRQTVFHEFGHVLSFQASQRDDSGSTKGTLVLDEGTLLPRAYLNLFYERFWKKVYPSHGPTSTSDAEGTALYNTSPASFVTEYAATGPLEDFAESFAVFVTDPAPKGNAVKDQKLKFFAGFPELRKLRDQMRSAL